MEGAAKRFQRRAQDFSRSSAWRKHAGHIVPPAIIKHDSIWVCHVRNYASEQACNVVIAHSQPAIPRREGACGFGAISKSEMLEHRMTQ